MHLPKLSPNRGSLILAHYSQVLTPLISLIPIHKNKIKMKLSIFVPLATFLAFFAVAEPAEDYVSPCLVSLLPT